MRNLARVFLLSIAACFTLTQTGCYSLNRQALVQSQLRTRQLYEQNQAMAAQRDQASAMLQAALDEKEGLSANLDVVNRRLANLSDERAKLHSRYAHLLDRNKNQPSPLSGSATRRLEELARRYPDFEFDPQTGVSKFNSDILFASGSDSVRPQAEKLLSEFSAIMNQQDTRHLNILVVGHTDDRRIAKRSTREKHPTNWHLSTNRADAVVVSLSKNGVAEQRMGAAGYSMFQPAADNASERARQLNRRVEIFVVAPDAIVAGRDWRFSQR
jgi:chemotaxis protein MotB